VLRSVSPIHIEYLRNMGVRASMSISLVVHGKLWGLIACHHYASMKRVPYTVRSSCKVLAQVISGLIERFELRERSHAVEATRHSLHRLVEHVKSGDDILKSLVDSDELAKLIHAQGGAVCLEQRIVTWGSAPPLSTIKHMLESIEAQQTSEVFVMDALRTRFPTLDFDRTAGCLGTCFHPDNTGWVLWFRDEEAQTVRWGGNPHKTYGEGPHGPRLSPRGSFKEYTEVVRDRAEPFHALEVELASQVRAGLQDIALARMGELQRARDILMAALSHDLRSPLSAIGMSAHLLAKDSGLSSQIGARISSSANRMQRLVEQMLDFSRIQSGAKLGLQRAKVDVVELCRQIVDETSAAFPGFSIQLKAPTTLYAHVDADRFSQVLTNLLGNARNHGDTEKPTTLIVESLVHADSNAFVITVVNHGSAISSANLATLFQPFKGATLNPQNRRGLGLGLFIVQQIVTEHRGTITVDCADNVVSFRATFPCFE